jgi:hypothetical protein
VSSGYIPPKDEPGPDEILEALREAIFENPRLTQMPAEEVARQLVLEGYLQRRISMKMSSCRLCLKGSPVAQHCPKNIDSPTRQRN